MRSAILPLVIALLFAATHGSSAEEARADAVPGPSDGLAAHMAYQDRMMAEGETRAILQVYSSRASRPEATADDLFLHARLLEGRRALGPLKKALRLDPEHFQSLVALGATYADLGKLKQARESYQMARLVKPESGIPVNGLGWVAEQEGDLSSAEKQYRLAISLDPDYLLPRLNLGILLIGQEKLDEAEETLKAAQKLSPEEPMLFLGLGMIQAARGDLKAAMREYRNATFVEGNTPESLNLLGQAYMGLEQYDMADEVLKEALTMRPDSAITLVNLSYLKLLQGDEKKARHYIEKAVKADPDSPEAHYFRGLCLESEGKTRAAEKSYLRAAKLDPANPDYLRAVGSLYAGLGRWKEAVRAYDKAGEVAGWSVQALMDIAFAHVGADNSRDALKYFEQVVEIEPDNLTAWMNIGLLCQEKLRMKSRAIEAYQEYIARGGKDKRVPMWLSQLTGD